MRPRSPSKFASQRWPSSGLLQCSKKRTGPHSAARKARALSAGNGYVHGLIQHGVIGLFSNAGNLLGRQASWTDLMHLRRWPGMSSAPEPLGALRKGLNAGATFPTNACRGTPRAASAWVSIISDRPADAAGVGGNRSDGLLSSSSSPALSWLSRLQDTLPAPIVSLWSESLQRARCLASAICLLQPCELIALGRDVSCSSYVASGCPCRIHCWKVFASDSLPRRLIRSVPHRFYIVAWGSCTLPEPLVWALAFCQNLCEYRAVKTNSKPTSKRHVPTPMLAREPSYVFTKLPSLSRSKGLATRPILT